MERILKLFSNPMSERHFMRGPWQLDGKLHATDGRAIIRLNTLAPESAPVVDAAVSAGVKAILDHAMRREPVMLPDWRNCECCRGTGRVKCCQCEQQRDCPACYGSGREVHPNTGVQVGKVKLASSYAAKLALLPGLKLYPAGETDPVRFVFTGGDGAVMPLKVS